MKEDKRIQLSITVPEDLVNFIDSEIEKHTFASRSHAFTVAVSDLKQKVERTK